MTLPNEIEATKPPLGLKPRWLVAEQRFDELRNAVRRYRAAGEPVPEEWLKEAMDLFGQMFFGAISEASDL